MSEQKTALVLGATGGIGGEVARVLLARGWKVRALVRDAGKAVRRDGLQWVQGDAMSSRDVLDAARGAALIVHAVNPPGYRNWAQLVLPMIDNTIAAARVTGARIVLPGSIYNYGPDSWPDLREDSAQQPTTRKGRIRVEMEVRLRAAAQDRVQTLVVRAGDFFGPQAANNWFSQGLVKAGQPVKSISYPGKKGVGHQWTYLPDMAQTMVQLAESESLPGGFTVFQMDGHWDDDGTRMTSAIRRAVSNAQGKAPDGKQGAREPKVKAFPWWLLTVGGPFVTLFREMKEMRYLWQQPIRMNNARLVSVLGSEPHTPLDEAVRATLEGQGCIEALQTAAATRSTTMLA